MTTTTVERLDLELYADRLARHAARLADEVAACRLRIAWSEVEADARPDLTPDQAEMLESLGILGPSFAAADRPGNQDAHLLARRIEQLKALAALQLWVEQRITGLS